MNYYERYDILKDFSLLQEDKKIEIMKLFIRDCKLSEILQGFNLNKSIFIACWDFLKQFGYSRKVLLRISNKHNKKIINEIYDKMEIFK